MSSMIMRWISVINVCRCSFFDVRKGQYFKFEHRKVFNLKLTWQSSFLRVLLSQKHSRFLHFDDVVISERRFIAHADVKVIKRSKGRQKCREWRWKFFFLFHLENFFFLQQGMCWGRQKVRKLRSKLRRLYSLIRRVLFSRDVLEIKSGRWQRSLRAWHQIYILRMWFQSLKWGIMLCRD